MVNESDILVVGAGPVGLFTSLLLATGMPDVSITILEATSQAPDAKDAAGSKAIVYQPNLYPLLQRAGMLDTLKAAGSMAGFPIFRKTSTGEVVLKIPTPPGAPGILVLPQWQFCGLLEDKLKSLGNVTVLRGYTVSSIDDNGEQEDSVTVTAQSQSGEPQQYKAKYLLGADGGRSFIRKTAGIKFEGETLPSQLVATDVRYPFEKHGFNDTAFLIDPENFGLIAKIAPEDNPGNPHAGKGGLWRVSFGVPNEAGKEEIERQLPLKYEAMFPGPRPLQYEVVHVAPYKCQQLCAETMVKGRILLIGDAAHCEFLVFFMSEATLKLTASSVTNPYAGLGLTTGFFDSDSVATCLINVFQKKAPGKELLQAWSDARIKTFKTITDPMSRAAFHRVQTADVDSLFEKDPMFKAVKSGKMMPPPSLATAAASLTGFVA